MTFPFLYSVERVYPTTMEKMWSAWIAADELERWYFPTDLAAVPGTAVSEAVEGGRWKVAVDVSAHGFNAYFWGRYQRVVPHQQLAHTLCYSQDLNEFVQADDAAPHHDIVIDFEQRAEGVWVRFAQYGEMPAEQALQAQAGMESYFDSLGAYLARS